MDLFKNTKFTLATEAGAKSRSRVPVSDDTPVYLPTKVEIFTGDEYVEVYNADRLAARGKRAPIGYENEFLSWEYNQDGAVLWESGMQSLSWDKLNFNIGLKGLFSFDFGDIPFEKVRMGDLQHLKIALEGGFDMEMVLKYLVSSSVEWKKEWTLKEDVFQAKYTFMVGTVPVYISVGADLKAEADGRLVDNQYVAWNAGVSTGVDLGLGLSLDLFFWEWQLADIDPINVFDLPLVSLPDEIKLLNEPEEEVLINGKREVKYHVTNKINLTGKTYNAPGVLVHFEAEGGELEDATEGTITATTAGAQPDAWSKISSATVKIKEEGGGDELVIVDEELKKADKLKDNVYVVDENEYNLIGEEDYAYWSVGSTGSGYNVDFCKEHPEYATVGWGGIFNITDEMVGKEIDYLAEKANGNENLFVSLGTFVDPAAGWEAPNNMIEFNADDLTEAKFMIKDNGDGTMSALAHLKRTDGHEGWFKLKATKSPW